MKPKLKNIGILVESLADGGAERSAALLSTQLTNAGFNIFILCITDNIGYTYSGELFNLGLYKNEMNGPFNKLKRLLIAQRVFKERELQFVLDFRFRKSAIKEFILQKTLYKTSKPIYMVRSANLDYYFPKNKKWTHYLFKEQEICALTAGMAQLIKERYDLTKVYVIPNSISNFNSAHSAEMNFKNRFIVTAGRLVDHKQFDKLLIAYAESELPGLSIDLRILGKGPELENLQILAKELNIKNHVYFEGFVKQPELYFNSALFFAFCSAFEGFPRVILEALSCSLPVVSTNCPTGPAELLDGTNGILVSHQDFKAFKNALNLLGTNLELRSRFASNCKKSIAKFGDSCIQDEWQQYLNKIYERSQANRSA